MAKTIDEVVEHEPTAASTTFQTVAFEHKTWDTTNYCEKFCPPGSILTLCTTAQRLELEPEEAVLVTSNCCSTVNQRRPYGELGSVDKITCCGIFNSFQFGDSTVCPGCGCEGSKVEEIVHELKLRMKARGDTGQIKRAEQMLGEIQILKAQSQNVDAKLDLILKHLGLDPPVAVAAAEMTDRK